jgi:ABC-type transport system involved in multi-copper enzyme maturation permease subunit
VAVALSAINVFTLSFQLGSQYGMPDLDLKLLGYNAVMVITSGAASVSLISAIFASLFSVGEFSSGMVRTVILRGKNRFAFYFSKLIAVISIPVIYTILSCGAAFAAGCYLWGIGDVKENTLWGIAKSLGMFLMVQAAMHAIYVMVVFLARSTGAAVALNLGMIFPVIPMMLIWVINFILNKWFGVQQTVDDYWIGGYGNIFEQMFFPKDFVIKVAIVSAAYFIICSLIGSLTFWKRDIK